ncbi:MAG: GAF domain-containing protein [Anaerolineae bacterium]|nr:GAF domain-containing protein [Anaerolineae bacterium]
MWNNIRPLFAPPIFEGDDDKTRVAGIMSPILWVATVCWFLAGIASLFGSRALLGAAIAGALVLLGCTSLLLLRAGRVQLVARAFTLALWVAVTIQLLVSGGIANPETAGYIILILMAGLLSGTRIALVFTGLSIASAIGIFLAEQYGVLDVDILPTSPLLELGIVIVYFLLSAGLLKLAIDTLSATLARSRQAQQELKNSNRELQAIRDSLEVQVTERTGKAEAARQEAEAANRALQDQLWHVAGLSQLNERMHGEQDVSALADAAIEHLCRYLDAQVGALFVIEPLRKRLDMVGRYAYPSDTCSFDFGEGWVGQAAADRSTLTITDLPPDCVAITSGLGDAVPNTIVAAPLLYEGHVVGVIEIGLLHDLTPVQSAFLQAALESIASAFDSAQNRSRIQMLLEESRQQAEEMRAINEELSAQAERMRDDV